MSHESVSRRRLLSRFALVPALFNGRELMRARERLGWIAYFLSGAFFSVLLPFAAVPQCAATTTVLSEDRFLPE